MHSFQDWVLTQLVPAFGRTLLHSLWQGAAAAVAAGLLIAATRRATASKRYNGLVTVYAFFLLAVVSTFFHELGASTTAAGEAVSQASPTGSIVVIGDVTATSFSGRANPGSQLLAFVNHNALWLVIAWASLFFAHVIRTAFGLRYVQRLRSVGTRPPDAEWTDWMDATCRGLGLRRTVALLQSEKISVPVAIGFFKPVILVPVGLVARLSPQQVEAVLLHELAHIRRHDYLVNLAQYFADAVFAFHPAVRWLSACIRHEREACCDHAVVEQTGDKRPYLEALVSFSELRPSSLPALSIGSSRHHLLSRVKTIITRENSRLTAREQASLLLGAVAVIAAGTLAFTPKEAEKKVLKPPAPVEKKEVAVASPPVRFPAQTAQKKNLVEPLKQRPRPDTVPQTANKPAAPVKWRSVSTNIADDGQGKTMQVIATTEDGMVYKLRKTDGEMVGLSVNGREIPKTDYPNYRAVTDALDRSVQESREDALRAQEQRSLARQHEREVVAQKRAMMSEQRQQELRQNHDRVQQEREIREAKRARNIQDQLALLHQKRDRLLQNEKEAVRQQLEQYNQSRKDHEAQGQLTKDKPFNSYKPRKEFRPYVPTKPAHTTNPGITEIISELKAANLVSDENKLSFSLTNKGLVVNGKPADNALAEKLQTRFIKKSGDSYSYSKNGGSTSTTINLE